MNSRGQGDEVFRVLIEVIMGALILAIILGAVDYFSGLRVDASEQRLHGAFANAFEKLNSDLTSQTAIEEKDLLLNQTTYGSRGFAIGYDIQPECINFYHSSSKAFNQLSDVHVIEITQTVQTSVYMQCFTQQAANQLTSEIVPLGGNTQCPVYCAISFGKKLPILPPTN